MSEELRKACEAFLDAKPMSIPITEEPECVDALVFFAKQQRAAVWREAAKEFDKKFSATDTRLDGTRDHRVDEFYKWCEQQAKALDA